MKERTLIFLKPDVSEDKNIGRVIQEIENNKDFEIVSMKMVKLSKKQAESFYSVHNGKPFFNSLVNYVTRGKVIAIVIEGDNVISNMRKFMGNTDPQKADKDTLRFKYGKNLDNNVLHGSDSLESSLIEIPFYFSKLELE